MNILTVNLLFSTLTFWIAAKIYLMPRLDKLGPRAVMLPILILHSLRHLGLMFLAPGARYEGLPSSFAYPAAIGDLVAALYGGVPLSATSAKMPRPNVSPVTRGRRIVILYLAHSASDIGKL